MSKKVEWITATQLCEYLEVSRDTFDKWKAKGEVPLHRKLPNGQLRFDTRDVEDWLDSLVVQ